MKLRAHWKERRVENQKETQVYRANVLIFDYCCRIQ